MIAIVFLTLVILLIPFVSFKKFQKTNNKT